MIPPHDPAVAFIQRWSGASSAERANYALFLSELCDVLGVPRPEPATDESANNTYVFERAVNFHHRGSDKTTTGRIDLYKRGCFVLEAKQYATAKDESADLALDLGDTSLKSTRIARGTAAWDRAMLEALGQAERYTRSLPDEEDSPPFLLVVDVGHVIELYSDFTQKGRNYSPFPDSRTHRIKLADLANPDLRERLRLLWTTPHALDPSKKAAAVTREVAGYLAELAKSFEKQHDAKLVAEFLSRCLFCMFAEDVELLPKEGFKNLLDSLKSDPGAFVPMMELLFEDMNQGSYSGLLKKKLLHFNGGVFASAKALPVNAAQLTLLRKAASLEWRLVEPAIFGTLLEQALSEVERKKLGAHYTPRAYVERLVLPTVIEPLREEWAAVRAAAVTLAGRGTKEDPKKARDSLAQAQQEVRTFHGKLCAIRVLDPACGSGNFLYVALELMKRLEGEVIALLHDLGDDTDFLALQGATVDPHQFLGLELNPRAAAIAELVLWIGYLQWHFRIHGSTLPAEPVLKKFNNIENRDAVLAYDDRGFAHDEQANVRFVWDRKTMKTDAVTGREVPDDKAVIPLETFSNPRPAEWPQADFIVGNPPFLGASRMREDLGEAYTETLRAAYPAMPESADFVMFWWHKAALETLAGRTRRFGFITTNSIRQTFNRRVVQSAMDDGLYLTFAIPDHPWIDATECAAVRIAMSVGAIPVGAASRPDGSKTASRHEAALTTGQLQRVTHETPHEETGENEVQLLAVVGNISAEFTSGADVHVMQALKANEALTYRGVQLIGSGFIITVEEAKSLGLGRVKDLDKHIRRYRNGRDLLDSPRDALVIDLFGLTVNDVRERFPLVYQHVLVAVKPGRDQNNRASYRDKWWIHGEPRRDLRHGSIGLSRYIATVETAKHRIFQFLDAEVLPDNKLVVITLTDGFHHGVLSSRIHGLFALSRGALLEDRPVYPKTECFDPFPFPDCTEKQKETVRAIAEELDAHRKRAQATHRLGLTDIYNVLEKVRAGTALTAKDKTIHDAALVSTLKQLHDDLDSAVAEAYGWPWPLTDAEILERVVALNAARAAEEAKGIIRWLRPEYQKPLFAGESQSEFSENVGAGTSRDGSEASKASSRKSKPKTSILKPKSGTAAAKSPWPKPLAERVRAVETALAAEEKPASAADLAKRFTRAKPADLAEILDTLVTLGRARPGDGAGTFVR